MAACFHPSYKLNWIQFWDPEKYDGIRNHMITMVAKEIRDQAPEEHSRSRPVTAELRSRTEPAATASTSRGMQSIPVCDDDVCVAALSNPLNGVVQDALEQRRH